MATARVRASQKPKEPKEPVAQVAAAVALLTREHQRLPLATVRAWRGSCGKPAGGHATVNYVPGIRTLTYSLSVLRYPTDTAHRAARQPGTLAQPVAPRGCLCPSLARTHRTLATLPHAVSEAGSRERSVLRRSM